MAGRSRILFITDDTSLASVVRPILEQGGFDTTAISGDSIEFDSIRQASPSLILLDLALSGINGKEIYRQLKADARLKSIPVIRWHP